jgi:hypothetical protein
MLRLLNALLVFALGYPPTCFTSTPPPAAEALFTPPSSQAPWPHTPLHMQHMQLKGTHNSYHIAPPHSMVAQWLYSHAPIEVQLSQQGVRQLEFDIYHTPDTHNFDVAHIPLVDPFTQCKNLTLCLQQIYTWSQKHPGHVPIFIFLEPKNFFDEASAERYFADLENTLTHVIPPSLFVTPAMVQGEHATLAQAIEKQGWPALDNVRNMFVAVLLNQGDFRTHYTHQNTHLKDRLMFVLSEPETPYASIIDIEDPIAQQQEIAAYAKRRFLIRTRPDTGLFSLNPELFYKRLKTALAAGAHIISTDFPAPIQGSAFWLQMPENTPHRCNPVTAPKQCLNTFLENVSHVYQKTTHP